ncbi:MULTISPECIES: hypothetical protein [Streptomyces]|uniref:Uncharacterized protein n=1 Tax=Streptomyces luteosporeus TaxID=173856 RepID=A0ABN3TL09_9ACTN
MAHEIVTVCLPPDAHHALHSAVEAALAPFDMNGDHEPYQGEWDLWWLGRPGEEFAVLPGHEDDPRLVRAPLDAYGRPRHWTPGQCDGGPRRLLDFAGMRARDARALVTDHLLTLDGAWGCPNTVPGPPGTGYSDFVDAYLDGLPPDVMVVHLRIHC